MIALGLSREGASSRRHRGGCWGESNGISESILSQGVGELGVVLSSLVLVFVLVAPVASQTGGSIVPPDTASSEVRELLRAFEAEADNSSDEYRQARMGIVLATQMGLAQMGFPAPLSGFEDSATVSAMNHYRAARGLPVQDTLLDTLGLTSLLEDVERFERLARAQRPSTRRFLGASWADGYVMADGPWMLEGDTGMRSVRIECFRTRNVCSVVMAWQSPVLGFQLDLEEYTLSRWDQTEIVSLPLDYVCTRNVLRLNRAQRSVSITRSTLSTEGACSFMDTKDLVGGLLFERQIRDLEDQRESDLFELLNLTGPARDALRPSG